MFLKKITTFLKNVGTFSPKRRGVLKKRLGVGEQYGCRNFHHPLEIANQEVKCR
jgi:hypothetical protein